MSGYRHPTMDEIVDLSGPGPWWVACEHPERPGDRWVIWVWACDRCTVHAIADALRTPDAPGEFIDVDRRTHDGGSLTDMIAGVRAWRSERGMAPL